MTRGRGAVGRRAGTAVPQRLVRLLTPDEVRALRDSARIPPAIGLLNRLQHAPPARAAGRGHAGAAEPWIAPFLAWAEGELDGCRDGPAGRAVQWDAARADLLEILEQALTTVSRKTAWLAVQVEDMRRPLEGSSREAKLDAFVRRAAESRWVTHILRQKPGLARLLAEITLAWREDCGALADVACRAGTDAPPLVGVRPDGDRQARHAYVVTDAIGREFVLLPRRRVANDAIRPFLDWLCDGIGDARLQVSASLHGEHGWIARPPSRQPATDPERRRLSHRLGLLLAGLHALNVSGVRWTDLRIDGDEPILVFANAALRNASADCRVELAEARLRRSVLNVGLFGDQAGDGAPVDIDSAGDIVRHYEQLDPFNGALTAALLGFIDSSGTFNPAGEARDHGLPPPELEWLVERDLAHGFERAYRFLSAHAVDGAAVLRATAQWGETSCAQPIRRTRAYRPLLDQSFHPDVLDSVAHRSEVVGRVATIPALMDTTPAITQAEVATLLCGRTPVCTSAPAKRDLYLPDGRMLPDFFSRDAADHACRPSASVESDLAIERLILNYALEQPLAAGEWGRVHPPRPAEPDGPLSAHERAELLAAAVQAGEWIARGTIRCGDEVAWVTVVRDEQKNRYIRPAGHDVYGGAAGIAMFLAHLSRASGDARFRALSLAACQSCRPLLTDRRQWVGGAYSGITSVAYALFHVGVALQEPGLVAEARLACGRMAAAGRETPIPDLLHGDAGALRVWLIVDTQDALLRRAATAVGRSLIRRATADENGGPFWATAAGETTRDGFAHGAAGIAWALTHLAATGADHAITDCARHALDARRRRVALRGEAPARSWCNGACGVAMGLATLPASFFGEDEQHELEAVVADVLDNEVGVSSLCHGELGNLEVLALASPRLQRPDLIVAAQRRALKVVRDRGDDWSYAINYGPSVPGLMLGVAGYGYALLRLSDPESVPSVLTVAPPVGTADGMS